MKVKTDFITNSSSSNYLVFIPDDFDINKFLHLIEESDISYAVENSEWFDNEIKSKEDFIEELKEKFSDLQSRGEIYQCYATYEPLATLLEKLDLVIGYFEGSGANDGGSMINVGTKHYREKMSTIISGGWGLKHGGWGIETKI